MATIYKQQCVDWGNSIKERADAYYDHQISKTQELIQLAVAAGKNPAAFELEGGVATINYEELLQVTINAKATAYADADARVQSCDANAVPDWIGDAQKVFDYATTIALLPYVAVIQNYAAAKIDLGEVYKGRLFGGDNALIPKARDDALNALGIGGDVAKVIKDPVNTIQSAVSDAIEAAKRTIPDIHIDIPPLPPIDIDIPLPPLPNIPIKLF